MPTGERLIGGKCVLVNDASTRAPHPVLAAVLCSASAECVTICMYVCGRGLGHAFLRHIQRTRALLFVLDLSGVLFGGYAPAMPAETQLALLRRELALYDCRLLSIPALVAANKVDAVGGGQDQLDALGCPLSLFWHCSVRARFCSAVNAMSHLSDPRGEGTDVSSLFVQGGDGSASVCGVGSPAARPGHAVRRATVLRLALGFKRRICSSLL